tara:strand:- start:153 stop:1520 length:1368 start_codon:yes stop_codon:yes gene_type:complete
MDSIDKFLKLYSYKFDKGYPDMNNEQDILLLESILKNDFDIILEAQNITDVLHETFFALAFESLMQGKEYSIPKNLKELEDQIDNAKGLSEKESGVTKSTIVDRLTNKDTSFFEDKDPTKDFTSKLNPYIEDAKKSAKSTFEAVKKSYPKGKIDSIRRVASNENLGVADNVVYIDGEPVFISLKYGKGQFGSLSIPKLLNSMYGPNTLESGLIKKLSSTNPEAINKTLQPFIKDLNDFIDKKSNNNEFDEDLQKIMSKSGINTPEEFNNSELRAKGNETFDDWISNSKLKQLYGRVYVIADSKIKKDHQTRKKDNINPAIDDFLKDKNIDEEKIANTISYLFRQDDDEFRDKDYLYVSSGGDKILKIPSKNKIFDKVNNLKFELSPRNTNSSDYQRDILIKDSNDKLLVTVPLNFRFSAGQFRDNYDQKGTTPTFDSEAFNEFFGATGDEIKVTA